MRTRWLVLTAVLASGARAEIIDRLAVSLDNLVITESEVRREIRLTAFLNGEDLDFSPAARRKAADRLVEQKLIRREIEQGRYVQPDPSEAGPILNEVRAQRFRTAQEYLDALAKYGISEPELKAYLLWQATLVRFIDIRFRAGVQVSSDEIQERIASARPSPKGSVAPAPADADALRNSVEQTLIAERIDKEMDQWLQEAKKRTRIVYRPEAFQ